MSRRRVSRRDFLVTLGMAGVGALVGACKPERPPREPEDPSPEQPPPVHAPPAAEEAPRLVAADCPGHAELTEDELATRRGLQYTDRSPEPGQFCRNCMFRSDVARYAPCIGCQLFAGPVAPEGWCAAWAAEA